MADETKQVQAVGVNMRYPEDLRELRTVFVNNITAMVADDAVLLDMGELQPQGVTSGQPAPAVVRLRVVMTTAHANRLVEALTGLLGKK